MPKVSLLVHQRRSLWQPTEASPGQRGGTICNSKGVRFVPLALFHVSAGRCRFLLHTWIGGASHRPGAVTRAKGNSHQAFMYPSIHPSTWLGSSSALLSFTSFPLGGVTSFAVANEVADKRNYSHCHLKKQAVESLTVCIYVFLLRGSFFYVLIS